VTHLRRRMLTLLTSIAGIYVLLALAGCLGYRSVLFPAPRDAGPVPPPGAVLREIRAADGTVVQALQFAAPPGAPTVVHFHGNGQTLRSLVSTGQALRKRGLGAVLVEYRGYGTSAGKPTEEGLYQDAEAVLDAIAAEGTGRERVVLWGTSLGTGVAAEMAARGRGVRLVLVTPFTSIPRLAGRFAPFRPASLIVTDRFDTLSKAPRITVPTLVVHGDADEVVPYDMGVAVARAIAGARLVTVPGGHHNDLFALRPELIDAIAAHALGGG
jgi:uncharacterized protein